MKRRLLVLSLLASMVAALICGLACAELQTGLYRPAELGNIRQGAAPELSHDSNYSVAAYPLYPPELEPGEGKQETESYCALCHSARYVTMQPPLPAATWEAEINKMNKTFGANIPGGVSQKIAEYLKMHYTPETRKQ